jgi:hypothetical protein
MFLISALAGVNRCEAAVPDTAWETALDSYSSSSSYADFRATSDGGVAFAGWTNDGVLKITKLGAGGVAAWETALDSYYYSYSH